MALRIYKRILQTARNWLSSVYCMRLPQRILSHNL